MSARGGSGNVIAGYAYDVFEAVRSQSGSSPNYWLFTGEQRHSDSSLYYLRARYYDPPMGRLLAPPVAHGWDSQARAAWISAR